MWLASKNTFKKHGYSGHAWSNELRIYICLCVIGWKSKRSTITRLEACSWLDKFKIWEWGGIYNQNTWHIVPSDGSRVRLRFSSLAFLAGNQLLVLLFLLLHSAMCSWRWRHTSDNNLGINTVWKCHDSLISFTLVWTIRCHSACGNLHCQISVHLTSKHHTASIGVSHMYFSSLPL